MATPAGAAAPISFIFDSLSISGGWGSHGRRADRPRETEIFEAETGAG